MRDIKKLASNVSKVAGSALLVGATLAGAASMAAAQSSGSSGDLGDYPAPFVDDDGEVDTQIVVGENAKTADVVGALDIAGSLGNAAFMTETQTVSTSGSGGSWSATSGVTLDTRNDQLYFNDNLNTVRDTLTNDHLEALKDTTFQDDDGDETDIEYFVKPDSKQVKFGKPSDRDQEDPVLYVDNPADPDASDHLLHMQANFEDEIAMNASDVTDEEIELFGRTYTISTDTTDSELVLLGSQDLVTVDKGSSKTITINGNEHTIEVVGVTSSDTVAFKIDGELKEKDEEETFTIDGQEVRVDEVIQTNSDQSDGTATFALGSQEITLQDGSKIEDEEDDDIDGTYVTFSGNNDDGSGDGVVDDLSTINIYTGAQDDDKEYVMAGENYAHPTFELVEFHFGGLNPWAAETGENVGEVDYTPNGDDTVQVSFTSDQGEDASVNFLHDNDPTNGGTSGDDALADDDDENISVVEGENVTEDQYFASDAGDFAHMWEVTNIDRDSTGSLSTGDEATIDLKDVVSGNSVEVDLDANSDKTHYEGSEVIDGQTYYFELDGQASSSPNFQAAWGSNAATDDTAGAINVTTGDRTTVYPAMDTQQRASVAFTEQTSESFNVSAGSGNNVLELPSTESTDAKTKNLTTVSGLGGTGNSTFTVGQTTYVANNETSGSTTNNLVSVAVEADQDASNGVDTATPGALTILPEDDNDEEHAYFVDAGLDTNDDEVKVNKGVYTGSTRSTATLESNDDVDASVDFFGAYSMFDSDEQQSFTLHVPAGQATAGAAVTDAGGELNSQGGGSGSVQTQSPTGWPDVGMLDSEVGSSERQNSNMILVGGPAVNGLVSDLAEAGQTWSADQYGQGQAIIQLTEGFDGEGGNHALVVAGKNKADTREAASYISNYADHEDDLSGKSMLELNTAQSQSAQ